MIITFRNFLNEYTAYSGPFGTTGFKYSEPSKKISMNVELKYETRNDDIVKDILNKYNIPYDNYRLKKPLYGGDIHTLSLRFLTYSDLEAVSIINTIITELQKNRIMFDPTTLEVEPNIEILKRKTIKGFGK